MTDRITVAPASLRSSADRLGSPDVESVPQPLQLRLQGEQKDDADELTLLLASGRRYRQQSTAPRGSGARSPTAASPSQPTPPPSRGAPAQAGPLSAQQHMDWVAKQATRRDPHSGLGLRNLVATLAGAASGVSGAAYVAGAVGAFSTLPGALVVCGLIASGIGAPALGCMSYYGLKRINSLELPDTTLAGRADGGASILSLDDFLPYLPDEFHPMELSAQAQDCCAEVRNTWARPELSDFDPRYDEAADLWRQRAWTEALGPKLIEGLQQAGCVQRTPRGTFVVESLVGLPEALQTFCNASHLSTRTAAILLQILGWAYSTRQHEASKGLQGELRVMLTAIERQASQTSEASLLAADRLGDLDHAACLVAEALERAEAAPSQASLLAAGGIVVDRMRDEALMVMRGHRRALSQAYMLMETTRSRLVQSMRGAGRSDAYIERYLRQSREFISAQTWHTEAQQTFQQSYRRISDPALPQPVQQ